jgi:DNA-binding MarR family transcriptional regulator
MDNERNFGFLLSEISRRFAQRFEQHAQAISLTLPTCKVLANLARHQGISQVRLAALTGLEPMAIVRILDHMEAEALVERKLDPHDRRVRRLHLTANAEPVLAEIWRAVESTRVEACAGLDAADRDRFMAALELIDGNLRALEARPAAAPAAAANCAPDTATPRHR